MSRHIVALCGRGPRRGRLRGTKDPLCQRMRVARGNRDGLLTQDLLGGMTARGDNPTLQRGCLGS
ncbi:MAG: hypothetical protein K2R98_01690 [Gemmataceae bacterium]|nr:hypothetical protein [Gemmataceae bacterium]